MIAYHLGSTEILAAVSVAALAGAQFLIRGDQGTVIRRNFAETFPFALVAFAAIFLTQSVGKYGEAGAILYALGRFGYVLLSARPLRPARKFAWALSIAGLIGLVIQAVIGVSGLMRALVQGAIF